MRPRTDYSGSEVIIIIATLCNLVRSTKASYTVHDLDCHIDWLDIYVAQQG